MPFDFNEQPLRVYGIWPQTPFPLEVSVYGFCQMSCSFCFANLNRKATERELNPKNSTPAFLRQVAREVEKEHSAIGFFLREKYPVCFSNTTDPFQREEKTHRSTEAVLAWAKSESIPLYIQTRGNVLLEEFERYSPLLVPGKDMVYVSICQLDDNVRRKHEPGAQSVGARWELARALSDRGIPVVAACNPYVKDWVPDPREYCRLASEAGVRGIWLESLHFTPAQSEVLAPVYRPLLMKADPPPMYLIGDLKKWYAACAEYDLDFFPTPKWDAYFGHVARHPECADPAWLGGKTFDFNFRLLAAISRLSAESGKAKVAFTWSHVRDALEALGVPNPTLDTNAFWYPFNSKVNADRESWNARLGKRAPLYDVLRYFWNHPFESQNFVWYHPFVRWAFDVQAEKYATDEEGDLVAVFDPTIKHHGDKTLDQTTLDWGKVVWPSFGAPVEACHAQ